MGITKNHIHTEKQIELARLFKALGHPARIAIIENLLEHENLNCNDLRSYIQLSQSTISAHIKELFDVGILAVRTVANSAFYEVNKIVLDYAENYLDQLCEKINPLRERDRLLLYLRPQPYISPQNFMNNS